MRKLCFKTVSVILILSMLFMLSGCGDKHKEAYVYFETAAKPYTLDAQTASSDIELMIVRNIYEGLMRRDKDGNIVCGAAESYDKNGLTYTFRLRKDAKWSTEDKLTAEDFVFGLRRAVLPETRAPFVNRLYCIKGAREINTAGADISALGVTAIDDRTLEITLAYEDADFLDTLTCSVAMPCNEAFFGECVGKYGLESKYVISNGSYSIRKWAKDDNFGIRLYANKQYHGAFEIENSAVYISAREDERPVDLLGSERVDIAFLDCSVLSEAEDYGLGIERCQNICWYLTIGKGYSEGLIRGFASLVSDSVYRDALGNGFSAADSVYPPIVSKYEDSKGQGIIPYNLEGGKASYSSAIKKYDGKVFPGATLYYYNDPLIKNVVTSVVGHWQQNLSAFINIEASDDLASLQNQLKNQSMAFAVFPVKAENSDYNEFLLKFSRGESDPVAAQKKILANGNIIPIAFQSTNIAYAKTIEQIFISDDNGYIDFSFVIKND